MRAAARLCAEAGSQAVAVVHLDGYVGAYCGAAHLCWVAAKATVQHHLDWRQAGVGSARPHLSQLVHAHLVALRS